MKTLTFKDIYGDKSNEIYEGDLDINNKYITSLEGCYKKVNGNFRCANNKITSFEFCPEVNGYFNCSINRIKSFKFCPEIKGNFYCHDNEITSFEFCPEVNGNFYCYDNKIKSFEFIRYYKNIDIDFSKEEYYEYCKIYFPEELI